MTWATASSNFCCPFVPRSSSAPLTTLWRANPDATSGAPACITTRCVPLRRGPSFPSATVGSSSPCTFAFAPGKVWALPILVRLYRKRKKSKLAPGRTGKPEKKQTGQATDKQYRTRPQLALEMIQVVARWLGPRKLRVLGDSEYAGGSISRQLPANTEPISRMNMTAALYELPPLQTTGRGRRRKKGARLSNPLQMARDSHRSWMKAAVCLYGRQIKVWYQSIDALWYSSAGSRLLRIVVVRDPSGRRRDDCFFSTDLTLKPRQILETFALR